MSVTRKADILSQLAAAGERARELRLSRLFDEQPARSREFSVELPGLLFDYSRNLITSEILDLLLALAEACDIARWRQWLFAGERINNTEQRAALHTLLRARPQDVPSNLKAEYAEVQATHVRMREFSAAVRNGTLRSVAGAVFTDVINIGIGGSHLGPELVIDALQAPAGSSPRIHFLSNVDPEHGARLFARLDPKATLVIVTSKTFTTQETLANAEGARRWLADSLGASAVAQQFAAVSAAPERAREFGISTERVFAFQDWVGGRYSLWSAVGLPIAIGLGPDLFDALLDGAAAIDRHFVDAPLRENMPILMALIGIWYTDFMGAQTRAVIPYRHALRLLPPYLQQLEMESNGKRIQRDGAVLQLATAPVTWGDVGTNAQHAFFQLLHQGTPFVPVEFVAVIDDGGHGRRKQDMLLANCFAQAEALMRGRSDADARRELEAQGLRGDELTLLSRHKTFPGNRPSSMLLLDRLDARTLGMLIALYEHRTFVQACVWEINPFDQMGVELGKQLAGGVLAALQDNAPQRLSDPVTAGMVQRVIAKR